MSNNQSQIREFGATVKIPVKIISSELNKIDFEVARYKGWIFSLQCEDEVSVFDGTNILDAYEGMLEKVFHGEDCKLTSDWNQTENGLIYTENDLTLEIAFGQSH